jgi:hypothetical protein
LKEKQVFPEPQKIENFLEVKTMLVEFDLPHWCCGPKGCQLEIEYGEMIDAEDAH